MRDITANIVDHLYIAGACPECNSEVNIALSQMLVGSSVTCGDCGATVRQVWQLGPSSRTVNRSATCPRWSDRVGSRPHLLSGMAPRGVLRIDGSWRLFLAAVQASEGTIDR